MSQLFYGKLSDVTPIGSGSNGYIRVRGDFNTASKTITNVVDVSGYLNIDFIREGQILVASTYFPNGTTIESIDTGANTITVADFPASTGTNGLARISPADGEYYIASASFTDPNTTTPITFRNITGSADSLYDGSTPLYAILGAAADQSSGTIIPGRFHKYQIKEVFYRNPAGSEGSIYIEWAEDGTQLESGDELSENPSQVAGIVSLTTSESLAPIFSNRLSGLTNLPAGTDFAAYQIEMENFFDDLAISDVYYTGSLVLANAGNLNFSGSGVHVESSGSDGVLISVTGGSGGSGTPQALQDHLVLQVLQDHLVLQALQEAQVHQVPLVQMVQADLLVHQVQMVVQAQVALRVQMVQAALQAHQVHQAHQELQV